MLQKQLLRLYSSTAVESRVNTAVVLLNMGGPQSLNEVPGFLHNIMSDRNIIQFPFFHNLFANIIVRKRAGAVTKKYEEIGGYSPIYSWTKIQGSLLCERLNSSFTKYAPFKSYIAFRYAKPYTKDCFAEIESDGPKRIVLFSQYPQYSCATSGSSFLEVYKYLKKRSVNDLNLTVIDRYGTHPLFINVFVDLIQKKLQTFSSEQKKSLMILFSAHSLPMKAVQRGDTYPYEVGATVNLVMKELSYSYPYHLVWQSRVGPLPWLGPFTDDAMIAYVNQGYKNFILVPIAFVNEHIETLHEMDIEYCKDLASRIGIEKIERVSAPNDHPLFISTMESLVKQSLSLSCNMSKKFLTRCPHCTNKQCDNLKSWFGKLYSDSVCTQK